MKQTPKLDGEVAGTELELIDRHLVPLLGVALHEAHGQGVDDDAVVQTMAVSTNSSTNKYVVRQPIKDLQGKTIAYEIRFSGLILM